MDEPGISPVAEPVSATVARSDDGPYAGSRHRLGWVVVAAIAIIGGAGAYHFLGRGHEASGPRGGPGAERTDNPIGIPVEVARPRRGGIERTTTQAGSVHAFEHASLYAKVSGYLNVQDVDIGSRVERGQLLAVIEVPELQKAVDQYAAALDRAKSRVKVAESKVRSAGADKAAAEAMVKQAETDVAAKVANQELQGKQLARIRGLVERNAVEARLLDEQQDRLDVAASDLGVSRAAVLTAQSQVLTKDAVIESAQADLAEAQSDVGIAEADLGKARVMQDYTRITSPYDGVVTLRSFHRGDFVRSATEGGNVPVLAVAVTDKVRVVLPVPDVDVPFVDAGDPATLQIVALPGETFLGVVSRYSNSEDPQSRNMRTEVDLPNPDGKLREGMYGQVTVLLDPASPNSVRIPSSGLVGLTGKGEGSVYVVRDGKARKVEVRVGKDDGIDAEILSGLAAEDSVIVRYNGPIADGTPVMAEMTQPAQTAP